VTWRSVFGADPVPAERLEEEVSFAARQMPRESFRRLVDLCCGTGRHARLLAGLGYDVLGIDLSPTVLAAAARDRATRARYACMDMRRLALRPSSVDGVLVLWQSFGYGDDDENAAILRAIAATLRARGRLVLDIYNPAFFHGSTGTRTVERAGRRIIESRMLAGDRLTVHLRYDGSDDEDIFSWRLYSPDEAASLARAAGLQPLLACADFDERVRPSAALPRMQLVFERAGGVTMP
jgi:SAM-dependent methyltransferase